jgi:hypothetical protein
VHSDLGKDLMFKHSASRPALAAFIVVLLAATATADAGVRSPARAAPAATMAQVSGPSGCLRTVDPTLDTEDADVAADSACGAAAALIGATSLTVLPDGSRVLVASRGTSDGLSSAGSGVSALVRAPDGGLSPGAC